MSSNEAGPPPGNPYNSNPDIKFKGYRRRSILHPAMMEQSIKIESFADTAYDELSNVRYQWRHILEDASITRTRRNAVTSIMGRLSVWMQICIELGKMADILDDEAHNTTPSAEAAEICELSRHYLPKEQEQQHD